jgi:hypothetical protein
MHVQYARALVMCNCGASRTFLQSDYYFPVCIRGRARTAVMGRAHQIHCCFSCCGHVFFIRIMMVFAPRLSDGWKIGTAAAFFSFLWQRFRNKSTVLFVLLKIMPKLFCQIKNTQEILTRKIMRAKVFIPH